jgi:hypothetical protein
MLAALGGQQRQGEPGADHRQIRPQPQQERHRADVVLVSVGEHERLDVVQPAFDRAEIRQDEVHARRVVGREEHSAVDHEQPAGVLEDRHVAADLTDPTECDHPQAGVGQRRGWIDRADTVHGGRHDVPTSSPAPARSAAIAVT